MKEDTKKVGPGQSRDGCADTVSYNNTVDTGQTVMPKDTNRQQAEAEADEPEESPDTARLEPNLGKNSGAAGAALGNKYTDMLNGAEENKNDLKGDMPHGKHRKKGKPEKQEKGNRNKGEADGEGTDTPSNCRKTPMEGKNDTGKKQTDIRYAGRGFTVSAAIRGSGGFSDALQGREWPAQTGKNSRLQVVSCIPCPGKQ